MKGAIKDDHIPLNKYELRMLGLPDMTFTTIAGLEDELQTVEMPDRTVRSGGNRGPTEFTVTVPMHHTVEMAAMELWFRMGQDPVLPGYKKPGALIYKSLTGDTLRTYTVLGALVSKRKLPDLDMANEGEAALAEYTIKADDYIPLP